ncbi:DUF2004 domain-containing protein [Cloacibacillus sp. An23]|uniref:DUF2004 domain-containing protein n=1 Tax=Cloacibacillus sp. An23 TaxID=1965591 RepID=UPI000B398CF9|nr:DUF2004 domain-containing protein [Cloacibacillus sp. An23]OUO92930.1 hypothetical protein B5F39_08725 [Cloacibacillus sp. An23]
MKLNSEKYPDIEYTPGEEIFLGKGEAGQPFWFDVEETLTADEAAMERAALMLDRVDELEAAAKKFLKETLADEESEDYATVAYFMEFHRDELEAEDTAKLFPVDDTTALSFSEMADYLRVDRFGSIADAKTGEQGFIMDLNFNPEITDELMVIYFDADGNVACVAHES